MIILIFIVLSISCHSVEYYWKTELPAEYAESFQRCADSWSLALDNTVVFVRNDSIGTISLKKSKMQNGVLGQAIGHAPFCEVRITSDVAVSMQKDKSKNIYIDDIMTHEIGHVLGLRHTKTEVKDLDFESMNALQVGFQGMLATLHINDINEVRRAHGLDQKTITPLEVNIERPTRKTISLSASDADENVSWLIVDSKKEALLAGNPVIIPARKQRVRALWNGRCAEFTVIPRKIKRIK